MVASPAPRRRIAHPSRIRWSWRPPAVIGPDGDGALFPLPVGRSLEPLEEPERQHGELELPRCPAVGEPIDAPRGVNGGRRDEVLVRLRRDALRAELDERGARAVRREVPEVVAGVLPCLHRNGSRHPFGHETAQELDALRARRRRRRRARTVGARSAGFRRSPRVRRMAAPCSGSASRGVRSQPRAVTRFASSPSSPAVNATASRSAP